MKFTWFLSSVWPVAVACNWAARIFDLSNETWWDNGTLGSKVGVGLIPKALLWASSEATVFFFGFDTPRPKFLGRPSLWWVVLALSLSSLPLLGRWGESAAANSCAKDGLGDAGTGTEFCGTLRGFGPGFLLASCGNSRFIRNMVQDFIWNFVIFALKFVFQFAMDDTSAQKFGAC